MIASAGWWVAVVELTPASARPYIGGSTTNSFLELTFGYNGLGRIFGRTTSTTTTGGAAGGPTGGTGGTGGSMFSSNVGVLRMFTGDLGGHVSWLIPAALILGLAGLWIVGRVARTDVRRAALLLWGATLVVTGLTFSLMDGTFHQYYTVALAPSIGALVGIGGWLLWTRRAERWALPALAAVSLATTGWAWIVLARSPEWNPWLRWVVLAVGLLAAAGLLLGRRLGSTMLRAGVTLAIIAALAGPTSWTAQTVLTPHTGGAVTTGPAVEGSTSGGPGGTTGQGTPPGASDTSTVSDAVIALLVEDADSFTWVAATTGAENAASYQLPTEKSVMPIGGFNGGDPSPTLEQFQTYVADGQIHYYIASDAGDGGGGGGGGGPAGGGGSEGSSSSISTWVSENFTAQTVDDVTVYDLTAPID